MGKILLITGGARSGKSLFAEKKTQQLGKAIAYIATAEPLDNEMRARIRKHQARRPPSWALWEAPNHGAQAILEAGQKHDVLLFDCLTVYLSNLLCAQGDKVNDEVFLQRAEAETQALLNACHQVPATTIFVTDEVGGGIVPMNHLARLYRDAVGLMNQQVARAAEAVYLVTCGFAVDIKKIAEEV